MVSLQPIVLEVEKLVAIEAHQVVVDLGARVEAGEPDQGGRPW